MKGNLGLLMSRTILDMKDELPITEEQIRLAEKYLKG